ncbi:probable ATP-dependent helicase PF08_0048, partial [Sitodiplosis mosellana]|uniref:probable ATP-dependent helicase PF08_0048 n=1 Tax=Sitodiplosis mosellana TaxID=263140 RepID=UPI0024451923
METVASIELSDDDMDDASSIEKAHEVASRAFNDENEYSDLGQMSESITGKATENDNDEVRQEDPPNKIVIQKDPNHVSVNERADDDSFTLSHPNDEDKVDQACENDNTQENVTNEKKERTDLGQMTDDNDMDGNASSNENAHEVAGCDFNDENEHPDLGQRSESVARVAAKNVTPKKTLMIRRNYALKSIENKPIRNETQIDSPSGLLLRKNYMKVIQNAAKNDDGTMKKDPPNDVVIPPHVSVNERADDDSFTLSHLNDEDKGDQACENDNTQENVTNEKKERTDLGQMTDDNDMDGNASSNENAHEVAGCDFNDENEHPDLGQRSESVARVAAKNVTPKKTLMIRRNYALKSIENKPIRNETQNDSPSGLLL